LVEARCNSGISRSNLAIGTSQTHLLGIYAVLHPTV
jgi:hypothetical protein